jgi:ankyrin repeat protein
MGDVKTPDTEDYFELIRQGRAEALRQLVAGRPELLEARTSPDYAPERQPDSTGLHAAIYARQVEAARVLIEAGIDIAARNSEGRTALHDAIEFGLNEIQTLLIARGAEVDVCVAAILGRLERLRELLDREPALANDRSTRLSPLGWASFGNQVATATELIDRGARMDDGELLCAASVGHVEVGRLLIERGADPNAIDRGAGGTALHAAAAMRYAQDARPFIRMLLEQGADPTIRSTKGMTAAEVAESRAGQPNESRPFEEIAQMLREA